MALGVLHFLNNVDKIIDEESLVSDDDKGGRWSKNSGKGGNVGAVGDIALDKEGIDMHNDFLKLIVELKKHRDYTIHNKHIIDTWMMKVEEAHYEKANKRRKKNGVTEQTEAPTFQGFLGDDLMLPEIV